jgi:peptide/nickel transport system ATP-binding protein
MAAARYRRAVPLLDVQDLRVTLPTRSGAVPALRGVSFALQAGQTLGLIGESGCGKSLTALALMGLLPEGAQMAGSMRFEGTELTALDDASMCRLRGRRIAMVFQEPMSALNPLHTIGRQIAEPLRLHLGLSADAARAAALRLLDRVQMPQAAQRLTAYPHQLSGGQRQRVMIAIALACGPALLIADEPTTALDASVQQEVLQLITQLVTEDGMALLLISHDLGLMAGSVQELNVMYAGTVIESGPTAAVLGQPAHPYARGLQAARPRLGLRTSVGAAAGSEAGRAPAERRHIRLPTIEGRVPDLGELPPGCAFAPRCPRASEVCRVGTPPAVVVAPGHVAHCWHLP